MNKFFVFNWIGKVIGQHWFWRTILEFYHTRCDPIFVPEIPNVYLRFSLYGTEFSEHKKKLAAW